MWPLDDVNLLVVRNWDDAQEFTRWLHGSERPIAFDTETGGLSHVRHSLRLVQFGDCYTGWAMDWKWWAGLASEALRTGKGPWIAQNLNFDQGFLQHNGVDMKALRPLLHDVRVLAHLRDSSASTSLKSTAARLIDKRAGAGQKALDMAMQEHKWNWETIPTDFPLYEAYGALDPVLTARLWQVLAPVRAEFSAAYEREVAAAQVVLDMQLRGMRVDLDYCEQLREAWEKEADALARRAESDWGIKRLTSRREIIEACYREGIPLSKRTPKGELSVDEEALQSIDHPLAEVVRRHRRITKWTSTYLSHFLTENVNGRVHPRINTLGARTGRMTVGEPPLQTLPRGPEIRDAFLPDEGHVLLLVDYSQQELRVYAHYADDIKMCEMFRERGFDIFKGVGQQIFRREEILREQRQVTKNALYAKTYVAGSDKFALTAGITAEEGQVIYDLLDAEFPAMRRFQDAVIRTCETRKREEGRAYIHTWGGRRVYVDEAYKGPNAIVQSSCADILKEKVIELDLAGLGKYLLLLVHDEVIMSVPVDEIEEVEHAVLEIMEEHHKFKTPLFCEATRADRWGSKYR